MKKIILFYFVLCAALASIGGVLNAGRTFSATISMCEGAENDAISAAILGRTSMSSGKGRISGTVIGATVIGVLNNGMNFLGLILHGSMSFKA